MHIRTRRLAKRVADTEFDSGWQALCAARSSGLTARQRAFLLRVSADEFRHATMFGSLAVTETPGPETTSPTPAEMHTAVYGQRLFADLAVGESAAGLAFWVYRHAWSELTRAIPEFYAIQTDEASHRFGALLHLRRSCGSRAAVLRALWSARLRLSARALGTVSAAALGAAVRWIATGILIGCWPVLAGHARKRLAARPSK